MQSSERSVRTTRFPRGLDGLSGHTGFLCTKVCLFNKDKRKDINNSIATEHPHNWEVLEHNPGPCPDVRGPGNSASLSRSGHLFPLTPTQWSHVRETRSNKQETHLADLQSPKKQRIVSKHRFGGWSVTQLWLADTPIYNLRDVCSIGNRL